jgi:hypothetical protein
MTDAAMQFFEDQRQTQRKSNRDGVTPWNGRWLRAQLERPAWRAELIQVKDGHQHQREQRQHLEPAVHQLFNWRNAPAGLRE